jgi:CRP/FNR family transcriptional regulator, cyclic AMP receptor protein
MEILEEIIANHPFWKGLNPRYVPLLQEAAISKRFEPGQLIFQERQEADRFCLIQTGQVRLDAFVHGRGTVTMQTLSAGAALGWSWLYPPYRWHFSAHANEITDLIVFDAKSLRDQSELNHDFGYELFKRISSVVVERLQETRLLLTDFFV